MFGSVLFMDNLLTNWARPFIVNEDRYVYPHKPTLEANWISLDDVAKFMLASLERPEDFEDADLEGAICMASSDTPEEFGRYLVEAAGDSMPPEMREDFAKGIQAFYEYNNEAPTRPFEVDMDHVYERFPELEGELETMGED